MKRSTEFSQYIIICANLYPEIFLQYTAKENILNN